VLRKDICFEKDKVVVQRVSSGWDSFLKGGSGDSRVKKLGEHCEAKEKSRGANINVSPSW